MEDSKTLLTSITKNSVREFQYKFKFFDVDNVLRVAQQHVQSVEIKILRPPKLDSHEGTALA